MPEYRFKVYIDGVLVYQYDEYSDWDMDELEAIAELFDISKIPVEVYVRYLVGKVKIGNKMFELSDILSQSDDADEYIRKSLVDIVREWLEYSVEIKVEKLQD